MLADTITIRRAVAADQPALARLALLDEAPELRGTILVAEVGGELRAAWSVEERRGVADPFEPTADEVALLRTRADHMDGRIGSRRARGWLPKAFAPAH